MLLVSIWFTVFRYTPVKTDSGEVVVKREGSVLRLVKFFVHEKVVLISSTIKIWIIFFIIIIMTVLNQHHSLHTEVNLPFQALARFLKKKQIQDQFLEAFFGI